VDSTLQRLRAVCAATARLLLVFHCLNLYSLKCILLLNFRPVLLGAPMQLGAPLQLGALSVRLVRLWVNPALS